MIPLAFAIGAVAGFIGTLLGIGGGALMVPLLIIAGVDAKTAVPASLVAILGTSAGGLYYLFKKGLVDYKLAGILELASITGALVGVTLFARITSRTLTLLLGMALIVSGILFIIREKKSRNSRGQVQRTLLRLVAAFAVSWSAGLLSALLGIGGGVVKVPILVLVLGLPIHVAVSTSKLMVGITAAAGVAGHAVHEHIDWTLALSLLLGTYTGAFASSRILVKTKPRYLYILAATYYFAMGAYMIAKSLVK